MAIDNFNLIKSMMDFKESDNLFMHLQILRRGKDHPDLPAANKLIKPWLVRSKEHLDSLKDEVVFLCEHYKARAYISCAPKSIAKLNMLILRKLADNLFTGNTINPWHVFNSASGELQGIEKRWVVDVDDKDPNVAIAVLEAIDECWGNVNKHLSPTYISKNRLENYLVGSIPTLNGWHLITKPFNLQEFHRHFPDVEIKKNGLTAIYVPECICKPLTE